MARAEVVIFVLLTLSSKSLDDVGKLDSLLAAEWVISFGTLAMSLGRAKTCLAQQVASSSLQFVGLCPSFQVPAFDGADLGIWSHGGHHPFPALALAVSWTCAQCHGAVPLMFGGVATTKAICARRSARVLASGSVSKLPCATSGC